MTEITETLKEKCERLRSVTDYRLDQEQYVLVMIDGRTFSSKIKNKFEKPFDKRFVDNMNATMKHLCFNVQGCVFGFCQSDEISLVISPYPADGKTTTTAFFNHRLCKIQSIVAAMATAKFNNLMLMGRVRESLDEGTSEYPISELPNIIEEAELYEFDCKAWNVKDTNDAYAWLLYRQLDCIRNSKQQTAQTYLKHKELEGLNTDEQITLLKEKTGIDWNTFEGGLKQGRMCVKEKTVMHSPQYGEFVRDKWMVKPTMLFNSEEGRSFVESKLTKSIETA